MSDLIESEAEKPEAFTPAGDMEAFAIIARTLETVSPDRRVAILRAVAIVYGVDLVPGELVR